MVKFKKIFNFPVVDLHTHLRGDIPLHTKIAKESGIDAVVYMANCDPALDSLQAIKLSLEQKRYCLAIPVSAITKNLDGKELVNVEKIKPLVVGFSDDGKYLENLDLLKEILEKDVLILAHCSPDYEIGVKKPELETIYIEKYLKVFSKVKRGRLHFQHISQKTSIDLVRKAKEKGLKITCETCSHYFTYTKQDLEVKVNPPLGKLEDTLAVREGLADGTIDVIASDYAPEPRITGIASFRSFLPLCYGLILDGTLTFRQLKEKLYFNPKKIIEKGNYKIKI